jgi:N-formylglutamate deformylase
MPIPELPLAVIHIPHSSIEIPDELRPDIILSDQELNSELIRMTDRYTGELFVLPMEQAITIQFPVSRLLVDPERFIDDKNEQMSQKGMGVIYELTSDGKTLRNKPTDAHRKVLLEKYYDPHHKRLEDAIHAILDKNGACLIVDAHSFSSKPLPHEPDQSPNRPDICIGTDSFHTPHALSDLAMKAMKDQGFTVEKDRPFSGSIVPAKYLNNDRNVSSVMIEVNRSLYMNEDTGQKIAVFDDVKMRIQHALLAICQ